MTKKSIKLSSNEETLQISQIVGKFIMLSSEIDCNITQIISIHFFKNDRFIELNQFVLSELTLSTKCTILGKLLKSRYKSIYDKHGGDKLLKNLSKFREYRNRFAHSIINYQIDNNSQKDYTKLMFSTFNDFKLSKDVISLTEHQRMYEFLIQQLKTTNEIFQELSKID